jgi:hypothetical protein
VGVALLHFLAHWHNLGVSAQGRIPVSEDLCFGRMETDNHKNAKNA